jgi:HPt (histidine-containing phosphotransfer) domain-containing protein
MEPYPQIPEEMKKQYLVRRKGDLGILLDALENKQGEAFQRVGHQLKGNASTYGFGELEAIGLAIESASSFQEPEAARQALEEFRSWLTAQEQKLRSDTRR